LGTREERMIRKALTHHHHYNKKRISAASFGESFFTPWIPINLELNINK
jgi:hypothetical protein